MAERNFKQRKKYPEPVPPDVEEAGPDAIERWRQERAAAWDAEERQRRRQAKGKATRLMAQERGVRIMILHAIEDPIEIYAMYKYGDAAFTAWCDAKNERGDNVWTELIARRYGVSLVEIRKFDNHRWLFYAYVFFSVEMRDRNSTKSVTFVRDDVDGAGDFFCQIGWETNSRDVTYGHATVRLWRAGNNLETPLFATTRAKLIESISAITTPLVIVSIAQAEGRRAFSEISIAHAGGSSGQYYCSAQLRLDIPHDLFQPHLNVPIRFLYMMFELGMHVSRYRDEGERSGLVIIKCAMCSAPTIDRHCGGCEAVGYCSDACADRHWTDGGHRDECE